MENREGKFKVGDRVVCPHGMTGTIVKIKGIPWGFKNVVRIRKPSIFYKTNMRTEFRDQDLKLETIG